ncbi:glycosyltransferase family 2 protein [candidate division KSB1 bacterium]|nr:glycosyltransferase family 2 protein [candidate division KSB1 bacterium]
MSSNNQRKISIIIPVHNASGYIERCLGAVFLSSYTRFECIVIDDNSTDNSVSLVEDYPVKLLKLNEHIGAANARNMGARAASGEILFFIDADVLILRDTLTEIAKTFFEQPDTAALIGSLDNAPGDERFLSQFKSLFRHYIHQSSEEIVATFWSGCGAIRRQIFLDYNGFDSRYQKSSIEDIELGLRLAAGNQKIKLQKQIQVKHLKRWTLRDLIKTDILDRGIPWTLLMLRYKSISKNLNLRFSQKVSVVTVFLLGFSPCLLLPPIQLPPNAPLLPVFILGTILLVNCKFYRFLIRVRGIIFTLKVTPLHLLYFFYCGLSFIFAVVTYMLGKRS